MTDTNEQVRRLLTAAADNLPGGPVTVPPTLVAPAAPTRRGRGPYLAAAFVLVLLAVAVPTWLLNRPAPVGPAPLPGYAVPTVDTYGTTGAGTVAQLATGRWRELPAAPIGARTYAASAWDGTEMLIWGGATGDQGNSPLLADGATYNPATRAWQRLPDSPLAARSNAASVWTGRALFVWGGDKSQGSHPEAFDDGALYDPAQRTWRRVAPSPLAARSDAIALWTGSDVLVIGGQPAALTDGTYGYFDAAAYNPATDTWRRLPAWPTPAGHDPAFLSAVAAPNGVYVWTYWQHQESQPNGGGTDVTATAGIDSFRYDADSGTWARIDTGDRRNIGTPMWTGKEIVFPATETWYGFVPTPMQLNRSGWRLDPTTGVWRAMAHGPVDDLNGRSLWTGAALVTYDTGTTVTRPDGTSDQPGEAAAWDPQTGAWTRLPDAPYHGNNGSSAVWTGRELIEWGVSSGDGSLGSAGLSFGS